MSGFPKIIHQIWLQGEGQIPPKFAPYRQSIQSRHQGWQYRLWDQEQILVLLKGVRAQAPQARAWLALYQQFPYLHQKVDFAKYVILWVYGGIYIDMDVIALQSLDSLFEDIDPNQYQLVISKVNTNGLESWIACQDSQCLNNGVLMSQPRAPILQEIIEYIEQHHQCSPFLGRFFCILTTTGPSMITKVVKHSPYRRQIKILPPEYFEPCLTTYCQITEHTYLKHLHERSWVSESLKTLQDWYLQKKIGVVTAIVVITMVMALLITRK